LSGAGLKCGGLALEKENPPLSGGGFSKSPF